MFLWSRKEHSYLTCFSNTWATAAIVKQFLQNVRGYWKTFLKAVTLVVVKEQTLNDVLIDPAAGDNIGIRAALME